MCTLARSQIANAAWEKSARTRDDAGTFHLGTRGISFSLIHPKKSGRRGSFARKHVRTIRNQYIARCRFLVIFYRTLASATFGTAADANGVFIQISGQTRLLCSHARGRI
jgi:hypothetical protein